MGRSFPANDEPTRHHRAQTSAAMKRMAKSSQCPQCKRKSAVKRIVDGDLVIRTCRWCKWEAGGYIGG